MAEYTARLGTSGGEVLERSFISESEDALRRELDQKGFYVFSIRAKGAAGSGLRFFSRRKRIPQRHFMLFNHEFATLLKAGLPVLQGLDLLLERMEDPTFKEVLRDIRDRIKGGAALSEGFGAWPQYFPPLYATSLKAGERSGELENVIRRYLAYTRVIQEVRKKVIQAAVYPIFLISVSLIAIVVLLEWAIPRFATLYADSGSELPWLTQSLVDLSDMVRKGWPLLGLGSIVGVGALRVLMSSEAGRVSLNRLKLRVPLIGKTWRKFAVSQLTRALSTLLRGGIPLVSALEVATESVGNRLIATRARLAVRNIREGESLSMALEKTGVMQSMVLEMVKVGESTGALAEMLENVANYYDEDIADDLQRFLTLLEPALLLIMGGIIATMLIAMYMPIFGLSQAIH